MVTIMAHSVIRGVYMAISWHVFVGASSLWVDSFFCRLKESVTVTASWFIVPVALQGSAAMAVALPRVNNACGEEWIGIPGSLGASYHAKDGFIMVWIKLD
jgi:hypothetical protein